MEKREWFRKKRREIRVEDIEEEERLRLRQSISKSSRLVFTHKEAINRDRQSEKDGVS